MFILPSQDSKKTLFCQLRHPETAHNYQVVAQNFTKERRRMLVSERDRHRLRIKGCGTHLGRFQTLLPRGCICPHLPPVVSIPASDLLVGAGLGNIRKPQVSNRPEIRLNPPPCKDPKPRRWPRLSFNSRFSFCHQPLIHQIF